jgi:acetyl esterase/lipase
MAMFKRSRSTAFLVLLSSFVTIAGAAPAPGGRTAGGATASPGATVSANASPAALAQEQVIPLWDAAPASAIAPQTGPPPSITAYLPQESKATGTAVIVCPGGAFRALSWSDEGVQVAKWLNDHGMTAFVLRYHLLDARAGGRGGMGVLPRNLEIKNANANPEPENKELANVVSLATADGRQALKIVRQNAEKWKINPKRIGIMGFSAGGGVAVGTVLGSDAENRPDFVATLYGPALVDVHVPADAPPLFIAVAADHMPVSAGCVALYNVWKQAGRSAKLHVYSNGRAGFGMRKQGLPSDTWIDRFADWMKVQGF